MVVFAHGSGSSRHSPRNRFVADVLYDAGIGTLLLDLLSPGEERDRANVFDIDLLAGRLAGATSWVRSRPDAAGCRVGYFGASTGAGAALWAAADDPDSVSAVVSRGGRPDLALERLGEVTAPTLLIVGGDGRGRPGGSTVVPWPSWARRAGWQWSRGPGTSSRSRGPWPRLRSLARDWFARFLLGVDPAPGGGIRSTGTAS